MWKPHAVKRGKMAVKHCQEQATMQLYFILLLYIIYYYCTYILLLYIYIQFHGRKIIDPCIFTYNSGIFNQVMRRRKKEMVQKTTVIQSVMAIAFCFWSVYGIQSHGGLQYPDSLWRINGELQGNEGMKTKGVCWLINRSEKQRIYIIR